MAVVYSTPDRFDPRDCEQRPPPCGCDCPCNCPPPRPLPPECSRRSIRYANGEVAYRVHDLEAGGFGAEWGHTRSFSNRMSANTNVGNGYNWFVKEWPHLVFVIDQSIVAVGEANQALWFSKVGNDYVGDFSVRETLTLDSVNNVFRLQDLHGGVREFSATSGVFKKYTDPAGNVVQVVSYLGNAYNYTEVQRSFTSDGTTTTESYLYDWNDPLAARPVLTAVTLRRKVGAGAWSNIQKVVYTYYTSSDSFGGADDLKTVVTQTWDGAAWVGTGTTYYRYYLTLPPLPDNPVYLLKYIVKPATYARMVAASLDPVTVTDSVVAQYADYAYEYDGSRRVTKETLDGGALQMTFAFAESAFADGYNNWKYKTTETRADGSQNITYANYAGQTMLHVFKSGANQWLSFFKYTSDALVALAANPAALTGYDEQYADLLHEVTGNYEFMKDNDGLVRTWTYHTPTGYILSERIQKGELGTPLNFHEYQYTERTVSGAPSTWFLTREIDYPSDTDQTKQIITDTSFTYYTGTAAVQERVTALPVVAAAQNGSGVAATRRAYYDQFSNNTWTMDERGFLTRLTYDLATKALTQRIDDVDTALVTDEPPGWTTPAGGGLHLITDFEHDDEGRVTQTLGPSHSIDIAGTATTIRRATWTVYKDAAHEVWTGQGYATGTAPSYTYTLINPVSITKMDKDGRTTELIRATRASTSGKLLPTDSFAQSSYIRWTTMQYGSDNLLASQRVYHTIPTTGEGSSGTNYDQTNFGYDVLKRQNKQATPGGTITRTVFDVRDNPQKIYVGTNDTGATDSDPTGGGATGNNMVIITQNEYDAGLAGGDNNVTKITQYVDAATTRETRLLYDWRNRRTDTDGEIDFYQKDFYDNLDRVTKTDRHNTTAAGNLIARNETKYDDRGRVYQTIRYGVDPATGTVANALTDNTWFDAAGNVIKSQPAGAKLFTKPVYDGLGRQIKQYLGFDLAETGYPTPGDVTGDTILEQNETGYDAAGNVIQVTARQRYHNATGTGALGDPGSAQPKARVTYNANWHDALGRVVAMANYGTNGGAALARPATIPARSDTCLVTSTLYNSAGDLEKITDPLAIVTYMEYDRAGRETKKVLNHQGASVPAGLCPASADVDVTINTTYNADGNVASITAVNSATGNQTTQYVYGTTLPDSAVAMSTLKRTEVYPDSADGDDRITFKYNRQREVTEVKDQNATIHGYDYDKLGRKTQDRITQLGTGVDAAVRRIATTYEVRGMMEKISSYDNATVGSGAIVNEVQHSYNNFALLITEYQSHSGAVVTGTTPKVQYGFANGSDNHVRPTSQTYPNARVLNYNYGTSGGIGDAASRIAALIDNDGTSHLGDYAYLGRNTFVELDLTEPDLKCTLIGTAGGNDPDTGDIYRGFDRFSRIKDQQWYDYGASADADRIKHGYNRAGNRTYREQTTDPNRFFDEFYNYDNVQRLKDLKRGTLNASKTDIATLKFAQCWSLDSTGNWDSFRQDDNGDAAWDLDQGRDFNQANEITLITATTGPTWATPAYNRAGNMTSVPKPSSPTSSYTLVHDAWNRLVKVSDGANAVMECEYDGAKRRTIKKKYTGGVLSETRHYFYSNNWQILEERVGASTSADRQFVYGLRYIDNVLLRDRIGERLYALQDPNWNVTAIANSAGDTQERYAYQGYGVPTFLTPTFGSQSSSIFDWETLFAGYRSDSETGLYQVRTRYLHSLLGTWLTRDSILFEGDELSLYRYVENKPLIAADPFGEACVGGAIAGGLVGGTVSLISSFANAESRCQTLCKAGVNALIWGAAGCLATTPGLACVGAAIGGLASFIANSVCNGICGCPIASGNILCDIVAAIIGAGASCLAGLGLEALRRRRGDIVGFVASLFGGSLGNLGSATCAGLFPIQ